MLRTPVALLALGVVGTVAVTVVTGPFWLTLFAVAGGLMLGATALSLVPTPEEEDPEVEGGADVLPLIPPRGLPVPGVSDKGAGGLGQAA